VQHYGIIAKPLTTLLKKKQFHWDDKAQHAFEQLKLAMIATHVLALPNFSLYFELETNACDTGIGAVLMQQNRPVAYLSKALAPQHQQLSIYEKEFLALIMVVQKWRPYLQKKEFIIRTDHKSLCFLTDQHLHSEMQKRSMTKLMGLQFKIAYKQGKQNVVPDALSRVGHLLAVDLVSEARPMWIQEVTNAYATDPEAQQLIQQLALSSPNEQGFSIQKGVVRKGYQIWIAENSTLRTKLISVFHDAPLGEHSGVHGTYMRLKRQFFWKGQKQDVDSFVKQCQVCQQAKHELTHPAGLLQPLPIPKGAWQDITMDFIEGHPKSEGYDTILVVVDRFSKYAHFLPLHHPFTAAVVAQVVFDNVVKLHGLPKSIVSDRDKIFNGHFWTALLKLMGIVLNLSTAYHP
jgi:hypothetical protein